MKYALKAPKIVDALRGIDGAPHLALMDIEPRHRQGMLAWMDRTAAAIVSAEHFVFENVPVTVSGDGSLDLPGVTHEERSMIAEGLIPLPFATCWFVIVGATSQERSEERRVGKECVSTSRSRWSQYHQKKKKVNNK